MAKYILIMEARMRTSEGLCSLVAVGQKIGFVQSKRKQWDGRFKNKYPNASLPEYQIFYKGNLVAQRRSVTIKKKYKLPQIAERY